MQAGARVSGHVEQVRSGQAGRRIIEEALDMRAAAIVMPLPQRINGASLFGKTLETVLAERPCRVIIESQPGYAPAWRAPAARAAEGAPMTRVLPGLMVVIGLALIVRTLSLGGGALALGIILGVLFVAAGAARLYVELKR